MDFMSVAAWGVVPHMTRSRRITSSMNWMAGRVRPKVLVALLVLLALAAGLLWWAFGIPEYAQNLALNVGADLIGAVVVIFVISPLITRLNEARREHLALRRLRGIVLHNAEDPAVLAYSRRVWDHDGTPDTILTIVNLDPHNAHETWVHLDTGALGVGGERFLVHDQVGGRGVYEWSDAAFVRLTPGQPAHVMHVTHSDGRPA